MTKTKYNIHRTYRDTLYKKMTHKFFDLFTGVEKNIILDYFKLGSFKIPGRGDYKTY